MVAGRGPDWTRTIVGPGIGQHAARAQAFQEKSLKDLRDLVQPHHHSQSLQAEGATRRSLAEFVTQTRHMQYPTQLRGLGPGVPRVDTMRATLADDLFGPCETRRGLAHMKASGSAPVLSAPNELVTREPGVAFLPMDARSARQQRYFPPWADASAWDAIVTRARTQRMRRDLQPKDAAWKDRMRLEGRVNPPWPSF